MKKLLLTITAVLFASNFLFSQSLEWAKQVGGTEKIGGSELGQGNSIAVDDNGNVYSIGNFTGTINFDPGSASFELTATKKSIFISKRDASGNFVWAKKVEGSDEMDAKAITVDSLGNSYITGSFKGVADFDPGNLVFNLTSFGEKDIFILKLDSNGDFIWTKQLGGTGNIEPRAIAVDALGNILTTGHFGRGEADFNPGMDTFYMTAVSENVFISKLDSNGEFIWAKQMGNNERATSTQATAVKTDSQNNIYILGHFADSVDFDPGQDEFILTTNDFSDAFLCKLNASGDFIWAYQVGGSGFDKGLSIVIDDNEGVYISGSKNNYMVGSYGFVIKSDFNGNIIWTRNFEGSGVSYTMLIQSMGLSRDGGIIISGTFYGTLDFDPTTSTNLITASGASDFFVSKLDAAGSQEWLTIFGGPGADRSNGIAIGPSGNIFLSGNFSESIDFNVAGLSTTLTSQGNEDILILKLNDVSTGINENSKMANIVLHPNPSTGQFIINLDKEYTDVTVQIYNIFGQIISSEKYASVKMMEQKINTAPGTYFVKISTAKEGSNTLRIYKAIKH